MHRLSVDDLLQATPEQPLGTPGSLDDEPIPHVQDEVRWGEVRHVEATRREASRSASHDSTPWELDVEGVDDALEPVDWECRCGDNRCPSRSGLLIQLRQVGHVQGLLDDLVSGQSVDVWHGPILPLSWRCPPYRLDSGQSPVDASGGIGSRPW